MTSLLLPVNIAAFILQITVIVSAGVLLLRVFRVDAPGAVLAYWRTLLLACLTLPFIQPWTVVEVPVTTAAIEAISGAPAPAALLAPEQRPAAAWHFGERLLIVLMAGMAARLLWLAAGAYGLWRLRRRAAPLDPCPTPSAARRPSFRCAPGSTFRIRSPVRSPSA